MEVLLIDTVELLKTFLETVKVSPNNPPSFYVDLEGDDLCRHGTLSLVTILVVPHHKVYLIDVATMGRSAFDTSVADGNTLRLLLESETIVKVFFDIRNDSDALCSLYGVNVAGIEDVQLMELASRNFSKRCVHGLAKCIENDAKIGYETRRNWRNVKENGRRLFDPAQGGSYAVFAQRPLSMEVREYCVQDVALMPNLRDTYRAKLCDAWWRKIEDETKARIRLSQSPGYNGKGRHMALGPTNWIGWVPTMAQRSERSLLQPPPPPPPAPTIVPGKASTTTLVEQASGGVETSSGPDVDNGHAHEDAALGPIARGLLERQRDQAHVFSTDDDDDYHDHEDRAENGYGGLLYCSNHDEEDDFDKDLTACDKECGYCGRCPY